MKLFSKSQTRIIFQLLLKANSNQSLPSMISLIQISMIREAILFDFDFTLVYIPPILR